MLRINTWVCKSTSSYINLFGTIESCGEFHDTFVDLLYYITQRCTCSECMKMLPAKYQSSLDKHVMAPSFHVHCRLPFEGIILVYYRTTLLATTIVTKSAHPRRQHHADIKITERKSVSLSRTMYNAYLPFCCQRCRGGDRIPSKPASLACPTICGHLAHALCVSSMLVFASTVLYSRVTPTHGGLIIETLRVTIIPFARSSGSPARTI